MYRQLAVVTIVAAALAGGALAIGSGREAPASVSPEPGARPAPAPVAPAIRTIEIDPFYVPQQMNFP